MKKALVFLGLCLIFLIVFILQAFFPSPFPENKAQQLFDKSEIFNAKFPQEKIYLQTDRSSYWTSDDIWFKAYLKDSPIPDCNLYVELLNSSGTIMQKKLFWAQNGLAYGDLHVSDTLTSGVYQIRAYTSWMRNFDDCWFFRKNLVILNIRDKQVPNQVRELKENEIDFQFFPEGGTFIEGVENKLAFKACDKQGKGLDLYGKVFDEHGIEVVSFKSLFHGMGSFNIRPQKGNKYTAEIILAGKFKKKIKLPVAEESGVHLSLETADSLKLHAHVSIRPVSGETNPDAEFLLVAQSGGVVAFRSTTVLKNGSCDLEISKALLPQGIIQFTLFDPNLIPICERLVFVNHHDYINVDIKPEKESYLPREKVQLRVNAVSKNEIQSAANLSMSVYNIENQLATEDYPGNILTWFLLNSELKGQIEDPAIYFKDNNPSTLDALDNLMLTHGYRTFEWKAISLDQFPQIDFPAEGGLQVRGKVKTILSGKPIPDSQVTMMLVKTQYGVYSQTTDSKGDFVFPNLYFYNDVFFSLQALNQKGKRNTAIELDQKTSVSPECRYLPLDYKYVGESPVNTMKILLDNNQDFIIKKWHLSDTVLLSNVNVVAFKRKKGDGYNRAYVEPDHVYETSKHDHIYSNIIENLENDAYMNKYLSAQFYLDGVPVDPDFIASLPVSSIDKIEVVKIGAFMKDGGPGVFFYLKRGVHEQPTIIDASGMLSGQLVGYSISRKFYSPDYETKATDENKKDLRSTIYWNPILRTDSAGMANVSFFNGDESGEMQVVVEGITSNGKLCRGLCRYEVKN